MGSAQPSGTGDDVAGSLDPRFFEEVLETAPDAIVVVDGTGTIVFVNRQTEQLFGYARRELTGQLVEVLVPSAIRSAHPRHRAGYFSEPRARPMGAGRDLRGTRRDGTELAVDISLNAVVLDGERYVSAAIRDASDRQRAASELRAANERLAATVHELEHHRRELELVNELGDLLQSCESVDEAFDVIAHYADQLFDGAGALFQPAAAGATLVRVRAWGAASTVIADELPMADCWAVRRGRAHGVWSAEATMPCRHVARSSGQWSACLPMIAQGEVLGLLHVCGPLTGDEATARGTVERLAFSLAEHLSLAIANLHLRESLQAQSVKDHLTGLFNRRYLDEHFDRLLLRATRNQTPVGLLSIDLDHFKRFNDEHGHPAGDAALVQVAEILMAGARAEDIVCRQGGEEFVVILPGASVSVCAQRAEALRLECATRFSSPGLVDGRGPTLTMSIGVAVFPSDGVRVRDLLGVADRALYAAKDGGRNRVVLAGATVDQGAGRLLDLTDDRT